MRVDPRVRTSDGAGWCRRHAPRRLLAVVCAVAVLAAACTGDDGADPAAPATTASASEAPGYRARIRWTTNGIPHIEADDLGSLGFGQGWALAEAHACTMADQVLKVRSERSRFLGPGEGGSNVDTDLAYLALGTYQQADERYAELDDDALELVDGYAAGFNAWLEETGVVAVPGWCRGAEWVRPITPVDVLAHLGDLALLAGSRNLLPAIAAAQPPGAEPLAGDAGSTSTVAAGAPDATTEAEAGSEQPPGATPLRPAVGGAAWAFGRQATGTTAAVLAADPQLSWEGELRLWEQHLRIPGQLDVYGATLVGVPSVLIGFNQDVAWTHTVAAGSRLTLYSLTLADGDPTAYRYGGSIEPLSPTTFTVQVRQPDGSVAPVARTLWASRHGPVLAMPGLPWTEARAFAVRDATADVDGFVAQWLGMARATSLDELVAVHEAEAATLWVDTLAVSADGEAWYGDAAATPALSDAALGRYEVALAADPLTQAVAAQGAVLLDGSDPDTVWQESPEAAAPGLVPFADAPQRHSEGVLVAGDHGAWAVDPRRPLTGSSPLFGAEPAPLSPASRQSLRTAVALVDEAAEGGGSLTAERVREALLDNRSLTGEELRDEVVDRCRAAGSVRVPEQRGDDGVLLWASQEVRLGRACSTLQDWDLHFDLESRGAALWRELVGRFDAGDLTDGGVLFAVPFDPDDPVDTPRGLAPAPDEGEDPVLVALAQALLTLDEAGVDPDAPLRDLQYAMRGDERLPIHGGLAADGTVNQVGQGRLDTTLEPPVPVPPPVVPGSTLTAEGYPVSGGSGFVLVVEMTEDGPVAEAILAYGQSGDPESPYYADQTYRFSDKAWRQVRFTEDQIAGDPNLVEQVVAGPRAGS